MPYITIAGPRIEQISKKRELVKSVTDVAANIYGLPKQAIIIVIQENNPENVGSGGELIIDRSKRKEIAT